MKYSLCGTARRGCCQPEYLNILRIFYAREKSFSLSRYHILLGLRRNHPCVDKGEK